MDNEISKARQTTQAAYYAYRHAVRVDMRANAPKGSYTRHGEALAAYQLAASIEARLRDAYYLAHGAEAVL